MTEIKWTDEYVLETYGLKVRDIPNYQGQGLDNDEGFIVLDTLFSAGLPKVWIDRNLCALPNCVGYWIERLLAHTMVKYRFTPLGYKQPKPPKEFEEAKKEPAKKDKGKK